MEAMKFDGLVATIALTLPLLALLTVILLATRARRARPRRTESAGSDLYRVPAPAQSGDTAAPLQGTVPAAPPTVDAAITAAEAQGDEPALARLYLTSAAQAAERGEISIAAERLLRTIRLSAKHGLKDVQAEARLELGDLARASGDLTTACEHWQIARALSHEIKHGARLDKAEKRMQQNGCPTDWVLNDF